MFWIGTAIFVATYILIASEKVHKSAAAMGGAMLMLLFILPGPSHGNHDEGDLDQAVEMSASDKVAHNEPLVSSLDSFAQNINFDVILL